eukprot:SAG11_NODE_243_length_11749_cov_33.422918_7_plen_83_part_00
MDISAQLLNKLRQELDAAEATRKAAEEEAVERSEAALEKDIQVRPPCGLRDHHRTIESLHDHFIGTFEWWTSHEVRCLLGQQ